MYVCLALVQMHNCVKYEGSMITSMGRSGRQMKKGCHVKNMGPSDIIGGMPILGAYVQTFARHVD